MLEVGGFMVSHPKTIHKYIFAVRREEGGISKIS